MMNKLTQAAPDRYYYYIPELFEKVNTQVFIVTKYP